jgi:hypothetical protein
MSGLWGRRSRLPACTRPYGSLSAGLKLSAPKELGAFAWVIDITLTVAYVSAITALTNRQEYSHATDQERDGPLLKQGGRYK